ncbi:hypothetical protein [Ancylobacter sp. SL191]|uniref:hypothetical protein n=1 Tax=Ancylobacter sp. SL191 TaxID=2995166 RepID=UPI002270CFF6|nr:hypothetical protein [Ancylobacter sp. SL191]WAC28305.1 hypothetical protein OU996_04380 [Ancylobacter sp. SL191]
MLLPLGLLLAGCAGAGIGGGGGNEGPMGTGDAGNQGLFGSQIQTTTVEATANATGPAGDTSDFSCPSVEVRGGAAAYQVTEPGDGGVRYQATLGQFSRECRYSSPDMTMRVGIQGRVLLGAKGGPGRVTVPIRVAVVHEGPSPQSIWTKFYSVPVEIGPSVLQVDFALVADDISFPRPSADVLDKYVVYVGFDPQGANEKPAARPRPAQQQTRPRPVTPAPATSAAPAATRPAAATTPPRTAPAAQTTPVQAAPATAAPAATAPVRAVPTTPAASAPATAAPAAAAPATTAPAAAAPATAAPAASSGDTQWIGAPAPSTGTFAQ